MKTIMKLGKLFFLSAFFLASFQVASAATSFSFSVPEGQGGGLNEFYHGRCVRADVMLDTDGHDTGGADLEINYDNSRIAIVNSNCSTPATTIYPDNQYDNYPNNHVTATKITLGAYNNPGNSYNGNGRFAYFYFTVLDGAGDYDLDFEFTPGNTTDTNLAETGSGNDILEQADSYTLHCADDDDVPYLNNLNPASGATNVQVISNILYRLNDDDAGINFSTLTQSLTGANWGTTNYIAGSGQISHSCHTTNANRVPYCDTTLNPSNNLWYCEQYTVDTTISDLGNPTVHTLNNYIYTFDTEPDNDAPDLINLNPGDGATGTSNATNIVFDVRDIATPGSYPGTGVNIATLSVNVSAPGWGSQTYTTASSEMTVTPTSVNNYGNVYLYNININPAVDFPENTLVTVTVDVDDYGCPSINHLHRQYTFTTADTMGPICTLFTPTPGVVNAGTGDNITFHCTDSGVGVDINTITAIVDNTIYTAGGANQFTYSGTPADYFITVDPASDFAMDHAWEVIVNARDFSGNSADQVGFGLASGVNGTCPVCETCEVCDTCEKCEEKKCKDTKQVITKYETCDTIKQITKNDVAGILNAGSKISNTQLERIVLKKINSAEVRSNTDIVVTVTNDLVIFEGEALPNSKVTLLIESEPIIVTGLSNNEGYWRIEMANIFPNGIHTVSAVSVSQDDYILKSKQLAEFRVRRWQGCAWYCWLIILILSGSLVVTYKKYKKFKKKYCALKPNKCTKHK